MSVFPVECRSVSASQYHILLANFDAAYRNLKHLSEDFNRVIAESSAGQYQSDGMSRIDCARKAHEDAHEEFMYAVSQLNEFLINQIVSSRSTIREAGSSA